MRTTRKKAHLKALTGIRFFAALGVVIYHYPEANSLPTFSWFPKYFSYITRYGYIGVSVFFVLSGFILAYNYLDSLNKKSIDYQRFWLNRFARVYPLYFFALFLSAPIFINKVVQNLNSTSSLFEAIFTATSALTLLQAWTPWTACKWNCPGWSLSAEAFFYLVFPFISIYVSRLSYRKLISWVVVSWIASLIAPSLYLLVNPQHAYYEVNTPLLFWQTFVFFTPLFHLPQFLIGVLAAAIFLKKYDTSSRTKVPSFARFLPGLFELLLIIILLKNIDIPNVWLNNGLIAPLFALLIFTLGQGQGIIAKFLSLPIFIILGNASYAMYILHIPVLVWMHFISKVIGIGDSNSLSFFLFYILIITGVSVAAFYVIETPLRKVVINRLGKRLSLQ